MQIGKIQRWAEIGEFVKFDYLFMAVFALARGKLLWRYVRNGSFTGAILGGSIKREVGEVAIKRGVASSQNLKVHAMESPEDGAFVGLILVSKRPLAASMLPIKLSKAQAQELITLLQRAIV
jgi:hypothetical protein